MRWRTAGAVMAVLGLVCLGLALSVVYPFTTMDPHATNPDVDRFTVPDAETFHATGRIVIDGEERVGFEGVVTPDGARYQRIDEPNSSSASYQPAPNATVYRRHELPAADADSRREHLADDEETTVLREEREGERVVLYVATTDTDVASQAAGSAGLFVGSLAVAAYEPTGDGEGEAVYEPREGWYDGREAYRLTDAEGTVRTDGDAAVTAADVSFGVTERANTYLEYLLATADDDRPRTHEVTLTFDDGDPSLERPAWVEEVRNGSAA